MYGSMSLPCFLLSKCVLWDCSNINSWKWLGFELGFYLRRPLILEGLNQHEHQRATSGKAIMSLRRKRKSEADTTADGRDIVRAVTSLTASTEQGGKVLQSTTRTRLHEKKSSGQSDGKDKMQKGKNICLWTKPYKPICTVEVVS